jgi:hypothetical protein
MSLGIVGSAIGTLSGFHKNSLRKSHPTRRSKSGSCSNFWETRFSSGPGRVAHTMSGEFVSFICLNSISDRIVLNWQPISNVRRFRISREFRSAALTVVWSAYRNPTALPDVFRPQINQLIKPYLGKPLYEQDAVEGIRFKNKNARRNRLRTNRHQITWRNHIKRPQGRGERSQVFTTISITSLFSKVSMDFPH